MKEEDGSGDVATKRRALLFCAVALVALIAVIKFLGIFGHFERIESAVVDASTGDAVAGVAIVALYHRTCVGGEGEAEMVAVASHEATSSADGVFVIAEKNIFTAPGPKTFTLGFCRFADEPDLYLLRPGYRPTMITGFPGEERISLRAEQTNGRELDRARSSMKELETLLKQKGLAEAAPAFHGRIKRLHTAKSARYYALQNEHIGGLQDKLKELKEERMRRLAQ